MAAEIQQGVGRAGAVICIRNHPAHRPDLANPNRTFMTILLSRLLDIILLRRGPQDLPAGRSVLLACLTLYVLIAAVSLNTGRSPENPTAVLVLASALPLVLVWIVLRLRARLSRWEQTLSALYGTSALLSLLTLPFNFNAGAEPTGFVVVVSLVVFFWSFAVDAHIWRNALEISFGAGLAVAMLLFVITFSIISSLAGPL